MKSAATDLHVAAYNPMGKALKPPQPIILLPGLCTNHTIYSSLARELNYPYGLLAMNYHSRGESKPQNLSNANESFNSIKSHVYDLLRVLRSCEQTHAFLVGHGFGGLVGLLAMKMFPHRISGMVLLDSGFPAERESSASDDATTAANELAAKLNLPEHILSGYMRELEMLVDESVTADQLRESFFGKDCANQVDAQDFAAYSLEKRDVAALRASAMMDLQNLPGVMMSMEELFKLRHPMHIVRADTGFPFAGVDQKPLLDEKVAKNMQSELNIKDRVVTIKGANHYSLLTGKNVSEVAKAIESLVCRYDIHWRINAEFESLKDETPQQRRERLEKLKKEQQQPQQE